MKTRPIERLEVSLAFETPRRVGRLAWIDGRVYFEYDRELLSSGIEISPFKLPLSAGVKEDERRTFDGLFGVFNDSLPDGWGRLLLDRELRRRGVDPGAPSPLERLAHVGDHGMGALTYQPTYAREAPPEVIDLHRLADQSRQVLEGAPDQLAPELFRLGGSSGGARPKVLVQISNDSERMIAGDAEIRAGFTAHIVKFRSQQDPSDVGPIEHAYASMARAAGIEMEPTSIVGRKRGEPGYFATRRFDRRGPSRLHVHSASGLLHADHRTPSLDYDTLLRATRRLTRDEREVAKMLRRAIFNVFAHNRDDHAKNFAFIMDERGAWRLAPAYDLTFSQGPGGEHATMVAGEGRAPSDTHLLKLGRDHGVAIDGMIDEVRAAIAGWKRLAREAGVGTKSIARIAAGLGAR